MKKLIVVIGCVGIFTLGFFINDLSINNNSKSGKITDYKDAEYKISGEKIKLEDGVAETITAPGSASKTVTKYFGNKVNLDLNDDGWDDVVFLLSQETGGSGIFYYVVGALYTEKGYIGSEGFFLGDRIAPQTTEKSDDKVVVVNYADRAPGESFSVQPSFGISKWLLLNTETMKFSEVAR